MAVKRDISEDGKTLTISITGRFDITAHSDFVKAYSDQLGVAANWVIDMSGVEYIDSSALGTLLILREKVGGDKSHISLIGCSPDIKKIVTTVKFDKLFNVG